MINGEGASGTRVRTVRRTASSVRLKTPAHWLSNATSAALPPVVGPPQYKPHPDTLACLDRCLWCLTLSDITIPAKQRKCSRCGKLGQTKYPLYSKLLFVEYF